MLVCFLVNAVVILVAAVHPHTVDKKCRYTTGGASDVYSFDGVLLVLLTGQRRLDQTKPKREHSLVNW